MLDRILEVGLMILAYELKAPAQTVIAATRGVTLHDL